MILNGTILSVYLNGTKVGLCRSSSLSIASDFIGKSGQGNGYFKEFLPSTVGWSVSVENLIDLTESTGLPSLFELITERTRFDLKITTDNEDDVYYYVGSAYLEGLDLDFPNEDVSVLSGEIIGDGVLERVPYNQRDYSISEVGITYNNLIRLNKNNTLFVSGQNTNKWAAYRNGKMVYESENLSFAIRGIATIGNYFLISLGSTATFYFNRLFDENFNQIASFVSSTDSANQDFAFAHYDGTLWAIKNQRYCIRYVDNVQVAHYDLGSGDSLGQLTANKHGVLVINVTDSKIQHIDPPSHAITTFLDVASTTYVALTADADYYFIAYVNGGTLYVACYDDTTLKWTYTVGTYSACSLYADEDRNVYICVTDSVIKLNNRSPYFGTYTVEDTWTPEKVTPKDIVVSPNGVIILASGQTTSGITYQL